jgi:hypothetical protein
MMHIFVNHKPRYSRDDSLGSGSFFCLPPSCKKQKKAGSHVKRSQDHMKPIISNRVIMADPPISPLYGSVPLSTLA